MEVLRTPEERFNNLEGYKFNSHFAEVSAIDGTKLRLHYLDEGPREAAAVLLMHGNPSWSYLYRNMIGPLVEDGHRVVAPDLIGFGRSDKPAAADDYSIATHLDWLTQWLTQLDLEDITLFGQDWGGILGTLLVADHPERFARVIMSNTGLPAGEGASQAIEQWLDFSQNTPVLPISDLVHGACVGGISDAARTAYEAPFPEEHYKVSARKFPLLIPVQADNEGVPLAKAAWAKLATFQRPFLTAYGDSDPISRGGETAYKERIPGAAGIEHAILSEAGHFIHEDKPAELVNIIEGLIAGASPG
jgi:haloalkane dehalogenase